MCAGTVRTISAVLGYGAGLAVVMGVFDYTGGTLKGFKKDRTVDEFARKESLRENRRRPIEELVANAGESPRMFG